MIYPCSISCYRFNKFSLFCFTVSPKVVAFLRGYGLPQTCYRTAPEGTPLLYPVLFRVTLTPGRIQLHPASIQMGVV